MTFDTAFERSHKPNTTMNADDKTIHDLLLEWGTVGNVDAFRQSVVSYITAIRKEARAAAFREAITAARLMFHNFEVNHSRWNVAVLEIVKAIEAATNRAEGDGDG